MKRKKEYIILAAVIIILIGILLISTGRNKMSYKLPKIERIDAETVSHIEIKRGDESVLLEKSQEDWYLMPNKYRADHEKVNEMLEVIGNLALTELVSDKKNYERYELDEGNKIHIKAMDKENVLREFDIGKVSSTYSHTYVRIADDANVYHAKDSFRSTFEQHESGLRDKSVMEFSAGEITGLTVTGEFGTLEFKREIVPVSPDSEQEEQEAGAGEKEAWLTQDGKQAEKSEIDSLLSKLSGLYCDSYLNEKEKENLADPIYTITAKGAKDYELKIYEKGEDAEEYPALSSENDYPFLLTKWTAEGLMKKPEDIFNEKDED